MNNYENIEMIPDKATKYTKYLERNITYPASETIKNVLKTTIPREQVLFPDKLKKLQSPGYHDYESGYCIQDDGTGYIALYLNMPETSPEMFDWFFTWHPLEDYRYRIWNPTEHIDVDISYDDRIKLLNHNTPLKERLWGIDVLYKEKPNEHYIDETIMSYHSPFDIGFKAETINDNEWTAICANEGSICHFIRKNNNGSELRSRIWTGVDTSEVEADFSLPSSSFCTDETEISLKKTAIHYLNDFSNLASILPSLYKDYFKNKKT